MTLFYKTDNKMMWLHQTGTQFKIRPNQGLEPEMNHNLAAERSRP